MAMEIDSNYQIPLELDIKRVGLLYGCSVHLSILESMIL